MRNRDFNSDMLLVARHARGLSQEEAVQRIKGISQPTYSRIEAGLRQPTTAEIEAIARGLRYQRNFFSHPFRRRPMPALFHRKRQKLSNREWERIFARAEVRRICITLMLEAARLTPKLAPPPLLELGKHDYDAARIAAAIRQLWMLPRGPVADVTRIIEAAGIIVVPFDFGTDLIDGFSERTHDSLPPLVFVNTRQPKDRLRFTLSHELGHIVMHRLPYPEMEEEANSFAGEFLMPSEDISSDLYATNLDHLLMLKAKWLCSVGSLLMAAKRVGRLDDNEYTGRYRELSRRGWRNREPLPLPDSIEQPRILGQLLSSHIQKLGYTSEELCKLFGLALLDPENPAALLEERPAPRLRLVPN
jgi:Zn-dependent peptidase ImmA (M78 family)